MVATKISQVMRHVYVKKCSLLIHGASQFRGCVRVVGGGDVGQRSLSCASNFAELYTSSKQTVKVATRVKVGDLPSRRREDLRFRGRVLKVAPPPPTPCASSHDSLLRHTHTRFHARRHISTHPMTMCVCVCVCVLPVQPLLNFLNFYFAFCVC
jgi:hypothetical protein